MYHAFFTKAQELLDQNTPFATAVVVRAEKPTSGKPGDKALISIDGNMYGWIGGSCSQPTVIREALKALKDGKSRFIRLSPDPDDLTPRDGLIDFPMTCFSGGLLEIFIEPQYPQPRLLVIGNLPVARALVSLGKVMHYDVIAVDPDGDGSSFAAANHVLTHLDDIARHVRPETYVVVATHGSYDETALEAALKAKPHYVGLVASRKRFQSVLEYLQIQGVDPADLERIKAPAGLDIQARDGEEIALSILAEIVQFRHSATPRIDWNSVPEETHDAVHDAHDHAEHHHHEHDHGEQHHMGHHATFDANYEPPAGIAIDPVCKMEVEIATAKFTYEYEGRLYYFCAPSCKLAFRRNPLDYLQPVQPTA